MLEKAKATYQTLKKNKYSSLRNKTEEELQGVIPNLDTAGPFTKSLNPSTSKIRQMMLAVNEQKSEHFKEGEDDFQQIISQKDNYQFPGELPQKRGYS